MSTAINLEPPPDDEPSPDWKEIPHGPGEPVYGLVLSKHKIAIGPTEDLNMIDPLNVGNAVLVNLGGILYPGTVNRVYETEHEVSIKTTAAKHMSRHWQTLLFYIETRRAVYGSATLVIPDIDPIPPNAQHEAEYTPTKKEPPPLDWPQDQSRDYDVEEEKEKLKRWYEKD